MIKLDLAGCNNVGAASFIIENDGRIKAMRPNDGDNNDWQKITDNRFIKHYRRVDNDLANLSDIPIIGYRPIINTNGKLRYDKRPIEGIDLDYADEGLLELLN